MDKRQKDILASMKRDKKKNFEDFVNLNITALKETYGISDKDMSDREFTLSLTGMTPCFIDHYDFKLFSSVYAKELVDQVKIFSVDMVEQGAYSKEEIMSDMEYTQNVIKGKSALRAAYNENKSALEAQYQDLDARKPGMRKM